MDARGFLQLVVPWDDTGYVTVHWQRPGIKGFPGRSFQSADDALALVASLQNEQANIYFCLSQQRENNGSRSRQNATKLRSAWMDVDVDPNDPKKYSNIYEAAAAVLRFCMKVGLPPPSIMVASGAGLHCYWLSNRDLTVEEWQPFADALKAAAKGAELKFDAGVTSDAARVLRIPGTTNWNYEKPQQVKFVSAYCPGTQHDFKKIFAPLLTSRVKVSKLFEDREVRHLGEGLVLRSIPPLPFAPIKEGCAWLREAHDTGGKDHDEPQWRLAILSATFIENGRQLADELSCGHPDYTAEKVEAKWEATQRQRAIRDIGWPQCRTIESEGSAHCRACPHRIVDKSPLNLGFAALKFSEDEQEIQELGGVRPGELRLPEGYYLNQTGHICVYLPAQGAAKGRKAQGPRLLPLLRTKIKEPSLQFQGGHYGLGFVASTDMDGHQEIFIPSGDIFKPGLFTQLSKQFVLYMESDEAMKHMGSFAPSWLDLIRQDQKAIKDSGTFGWRWENSKRVGFVYNNLLFHENGNEIPLINKADDEFRQWYTPIGSKDVWLKACRILTDRKRPELDILIAVGFAAPLMSFAGALYGGIISCWGEPGTSKSSAQQVAAAIWGHPKQTRESLTSTAKSVQTRLGKTRNLAAYWDDIQDEKHQESLFQTLFVATEGAEGGKLNPDSTMKQRLEWHTILAACSNASFVEFLTKKQKSTTAGMRRVFEFEYNRRDNEPGMINKLEANKAFAALEHNFGQIGIEYARILAKEHVEIDKMVAAIANRFMDQVEGTSDENYWWGMCSVLIVGAMLARRLGADLDVPAMEEFLLQAYLKNRRIRAGEATEGGTHANTEHGLTGFLNMYLNAGNVIYTDRLFRTKSNPITIIRWPGSDRPIFIHVARDERRIVISRRVFRDYLQKIGIHARQVMNGLTTFYHAKESKLTLGAGTPYAQAQENVLEIVVPVGNDVLEELLTARGEPKEKAKPSA